MAERNAPTHSHNRIPDELALVPRADRLFTGIQAWSASCCEEVLVGLAVGPSFLGLITYTTFVGRIAHLGAIILLFVIGLEFGLKDISKICCVVIGLVGFLIPCLGGFCVARFYHFEPHRAFLIGVALGATGITISAEVLREPGKLRSAVGKTIIGAGVIGNELALVGISLAKEIGAALFSFHVTSLTVLKAIGFLVLGTLID
jgi:Kef-type K+ transport system membrane component KefB